MKALSFGEILWDIYPDKKYIGGAPFNFAAHLAKHGEEIHMLSCLGTDDLGEEALLRLKDFGVLTDFVTRSPSKRTGHSLVTLDENGAASYDLKQDVAYDYISCDAVCGDFDVLYFGTLALRGEYNLHSLSGLLKRQSFKDIFVDINIRAPFYSSELIEFCVNHATILKVSLEELPTAASLLAADPAVGYRAFAKLLIERYPNLKLIVITLGEDGAYCYDCKNGQEYSCESQKVTVASTVGAGDSFSAAFLHQYFSDNGIRFSLEYASKIAGYVVSKYDAVPDYNITDFIETIR